MGFGLEKESEGIRNWNLSKRIKKKGADIRSAPMMVLGYFNVAMIV